MTIRNILFYALIVRDHFTVTIFKMVNYLSFQESVTTNQLVASLAMGLIAWVALPKLMLPIQADDDVEYAQFTR